MPWFRSKVELPFWEVPPFRGASAAALSQHGITCVSTGDFKGAMATGWAIWNLAGLDADMAQILLDEGYLGWSAEGATTYERAAFLLAYFERLRVIHPEIPVDTDVWALPRHVAQPASVYYGARAWAASELCEIDADAGVITPAVRHELVLAFQQTPPMFMAARSDVHLREMLEQGGDDVSW
jgi:hypothetical protein